MILVIGGTSEGRQLAEYLARKNYRVMVSVTTDLGEDLLQNTGVEIIRRRFTADDLTQLLVDRQIQAVVDASHPFAVEISRLAMAVCEASGVVYLRYERKGAELPNHPLVVPVDTWEEAAAYLCAGPYETVFSSVGVKPLPILARAGLMTKKRVVARVLPLESSIRTCKELGVAEIVAFCGTADRALNIAMFRHYRAGTLLTKDSGRAGGVDAKIEAALALNIPVVVVNKPAIPYRLQATTLAEMEILFQESGVREQMTENHVS